VRAGRHRRGVPEGPGRLRAALTFTPARVWRARGRSRPRCCGGPTGPGPARRSGRDWRREGFGRIRRGRDDSQILEDYSGCIRQNGDAPRRLHSSPLLPLSVPRIPEVLLTGRVSDISWHDALALCCVGVTSAACTLSPYEQASCVSREERLVLVAVTARLRKTSE
jgi:hypothetical protein